jgi:hypothetical protein
MQLFREYLQFLIDATLKFILGYFKQCVPAEGPFKADHYRY